MKWLSRLKPRRRERKRFLHNDSAVSVVCTRLSGLKPLRRFVSAEAQRRFKMTWPHEKQSDLQAFYGKFQLGANGKPTETWKAKNLTSFIAPYPLTLSWDLTKTATRVTCHKQV